MGWGGHGSFKAIQWSNYDNNWLLDLSWINRRKRISSDSEQGGNIGRLKGLNGVAGLLEGIFRKGNWWKESRMCKLRLLMGFSY